MKTWVPFTITDSRLTLGEPMPSGRDVLLDCDLFAEWDGPVHVMMGGKLCRTWRLPGCGAVIGKPVEAEARVASNPPIFSIADLRRDIFAAIDAHPDVRFLVPVWDAGTMKDGWEMIGRDVIPDDECGIPIACPWKRKNVTLLHPVATQADLESLDPFLRLADLAGLGVLASPVEKIDLLPQLRFGIPVLDPLVLHGGDRALWDGVRRQAESAGIEILEGA